MSLNCSVSFEADVECRVTIWCWSIFLFLIFFFNESRARKGKIEKLKICLRVRCQKEKKKDLLEKIKKPKEEKDLIDVHRVASRRFLIVSFLSLHHVPSSGLK